MADHSEYSNTPDRLTGDDLRAMFSTATKLLERNVASINALNVFPVPDGDTGTNMFLTLRTVIDQINTMTGASAADVAAEMARGALMGARGNSGVILSQFFKGMAVGFEGTSDFGAKELVIALKKAREYSYRAVGEPIEGTMLTVISDVATAAHVAFDLNGRILDVCEAATVAARDSVARTPTMLSVLREAGVVDAGGQGLMVILEGIRRSVAGEAFYDLEIAPPDPIGVDETVSAVSDEFLSTTDEKIYGYCTQFLIEGHELAPDAIRNRLKDLANSTVVVGDDTMVKVHVHAEDPGPAVSVGISYGKLSQINIQNMDDQHVEFSGALRREKEVATVATVAVAHGSGLNALFSSLGADRIITGDNTMNPSVQEIAETLESVLSDNVILLPNNRNIVSAAVQASELSKKTVKVVSTRSIPQGIAAILSFNPERDLESNVNDMAVAVTSVQSGEVTKAVRAATLNGVTVNPGHLIGLMEHKLMVAGDNLSEVVASTLRKSTVSKGDLVTLYWGDQLTKDEANIVKEDVMVAFPGAEVELVEGGQPYYHFLLSVE